MSEPFVPRQKPFRKRKKHEGQNWDQSTTIAELEDAKRKGRLYCKTCRKFRPWAKMYPKWRVTKKYIERAWQCGECLSVCRVDTFQRKRKKKSKRRGKKSKHTP